MRACQHACVRSSVRACVRASVRACVHACVNGLVGQWVCVWAVGHCGWVCTAGGVNNVLRPIQAFATNHLCIKIEDV